MIAARIIGQILGYSFAIGLLLGIYFLFALPAGALFMFIVSLFTIIPPIGFIESVFLWWTILFLVFITSLFLRK